MLKSSAIFVFLLAFTQINFAQDKAGHMDMSKYREQAKKHFEERLNHTFEPLEAWPCINTGDFEIYGTGKPTVVYLGFYGCAPCRELMPTFMEVAQKEVGNINFVYVTFDDSADVMKEMAGLHNYRSDVIKLVSLSKTYIKHHHMADFGYPVIYLLDANYTLKMVDAFGFDHGALTSTATWNKMLQTIKD